LVIATKYAFFREEDLRKMEKGPEEWSPTDSNANMLLGGWIGAPRRIEGLLDKAVLLSMDVCDVDLSKVNFKRHIDEVEEEEARNRKRDADEDEQETCVRAKRARHLEGSGRATSRKASTRSSAGYFRAPLY
jgi:hypothetical protein